MRRFIDNYIAVAFVAALLSAAGNTFAADSGFQRSYSEPAPNDPRYALQFSKPHSLEATLTFDLDAPRFAADEWVVYAAQPPRLAGQTPVTVRLVPDGQEWDELSSPQRKLVRARLSGTHASKDSFSVRLEYRATLHARHLVEIAAGENHPPAERLSSAERTRFLAANSLYDFATADFRHWLEREHLTCSAHESQIDFARRVFLALRSRLRYEYHNQMDRRASHVATSAVSDCAGMSLLFAATLRASNIPARVVAGRWARSSKPDQIVGNVKYYQQHVKAEFYADEVGWIPVDLSSAVQHDYSAAGLDYFGHDAGNFLTVHIDPLITVDTIHYGSQTVPWLQGVHYYAHGKGTLAGNEVSETWHVHWLGANGRENP